MRSFPRIVTAGGLICGLAFLAAWSRQDEPAAPSQSRIIEGPSNVRAFAPADTSIEVDGLTVNLRDVFDDLGPDAAEWFQHVQTLANPFFEGRGPGSPGMARAADYVEFHFKKAGLEPAFATADAADAADWTSYRQGFDFPAPDKPVTVEAAEVRFAGRSLEDGKEFTVLGSSANGEITAPISFVGYAIAKGQDEYTSFDDGTDLTGRIALMLRYEPLDEEGRSRWAEERFSGQASMGGKVRALVERGAAGIIMVNPPGAVDGREGLEPIERSTRFGRDLKIPAVQLSPEAADALLQKADPERRDLMTWRKLADAGTVRTVNLAYDHPATLRTQLRRERIHTENIGGVLRGSGALKDQWVVIGGHYDHVGFGFWGTGNPEARGRIHPGADDNASGTAALLILARRLAEDYAAQTVADRRSILFLAFSAEEIGLLGSEHYVGHPSVPVDDIQIMLNMDMVGRLRSDTLSVGGTGTAEGLDDVLRPHFESSGLTIAASPGGSGPSDHASFYRADVPVLFLFTGMHDEYHTPADIATTVNPGGAARVMDLVEALAMDFATQPEELAFVETASGPGQDRAYAPVRLGIQPGFGEDGVTVGSVSEGTAAAEAGILAGDILLKWEDAELNSMRDLFEQLQKHQPGDVVKIELQRGDAFLSVTATLKASAPRE
jgi:hypothetical protein